jgi:hypothetical protein
LLLLLLLLLLLFWLIKEDVGKETEEDKDEGEAISQSVDAANKVYAHAKTQRDNRSDGLFVGNVILLTQDHA